jgi:hypothetical protein
MYSFFFYLLLFLSYLGMKCKSKWEKQVTNMELERGWEPQGRLDGIALFILIEEIWKEIQGTEGTLPLPPYYKVT